MVLVLNSVCALSQAHSQDVNCVKWHPKDGGLLASASDDCTVKLWRYKSDSGD